MTPKFNRRLLHAAGGLLPLSLLTVGGAASATPSLAQAVRATAAMVPLLSVGAVSRTGSPPSPSDCYKKDHGISCYGPSDMAAEYNFNGAYAKGRRRVRLDDMHETPLQVERLQGIWDRSAEEAGLTCARSSPHYRPR